MRTVLLTIVLMVAFLAVAIIFLVLTQKPLEQKLVEVRVGNAIFEAEIVDQPLSWQRGLSGRDQLVENRGMLFIFPDRQIRNFWMKDMRFSIDIIWISENEIIGLVQNARPESAEPYTIFTSPEPVDKVLEINAEMAQKLGIKIGDRVEF